MSLWSYSIYLSHIAVLFTVYKCLDIIQIGALGNLISKVVGVIISIVVSKYIYEYFEVPITKKRPDEIKIK